MKISSRLMKVAQMVTPGKKVADIGTDHGYVPIYLVLNNICDKALAMDINKGPIIRAQENIDAYNLHDKIETRLSDGLNAMKPGEAQSIVIAGMGGELIVKILEQGKDVLRGADEFILSPHSEIEDVRRYLSANNYRIVDEQMLKDDGKYYTIMKCINGKMEEYSDIEYCFGKYSIESKSGVLIEYLQKELAQNITIINKLNENNTSNAEKRKAQINNYICMINKTIDLMSN